MIGADFATAAVLISFGVVLGVASPLQLVIMTGAASQICSLYLGVTLQWWRLFCSS